MFSSEIDELRGNNLTLDSYMQAPKKLFDTNYYSNKELGWLARLVYIDMLDLLRISLKRGMNYIYYTQQTIINKFEVNPRTAKKVFDELLNCGLITIQLERMEGCRPKYKVYLYILGECTVENPYED